MTALDSFATRQLAFGLALSAVLAAFSGLFLFVGRHPKPDVATAEGSKKPVAYERSTQVGTLEIGSSFSNRWSPIIQEVPLFPAEPHTAEGAADDLGSTRSEYLAQNVEITTQLTAPLPRRRPPSADEPRVLLPRARPDGPTPRSVFVAVGLSDDRYPSP